MTEKIRLENVKKEKTSVGKEVGKLLLLTVSASIFAFNVKSFVTAGNLVPGGFSGIAILGQYISKDYWNLSIPYSALYLPLNAIPIIVALRNIGKRFTFYSIYVIVVSSVLTDLIPVINVTEDILLISVFGGILNGVGISICVLCGACSGGTDFISIYFSERKGISTWNYVLAFNALIILSAGLIYGYDYALYSIIYQFVGTQVLNFMDRRMQKDTLLIITEMPDEVSTVINNLTLHASTIIKGQGGFSGMDKYLVYSVIGRNEAAKLTLEIKKVDPNAFVNVLRTDRLSGNFYMKPR